MEIELHEITVGELVKDYKDDGEGGVVGYGGKLDIRPPYQREFVYADEQRDAVIDTLSKGFPLNVMYWADREDGTYEVMDGQQRTIAIARYLTGEFSHDFADGTPKFAHNLTPEQKQKLEDYTLFVYVCKGTSEDKLDWFKTINIAGEELTRQELRNAVYHGTWLADAKRWFSRSGGAADKVSQDYVNAKTIRQEMLETALKWIILRDELKTVEDYMAKHQNDEDAEDLWDHFQTVIKWAKKTFPKKRRELKSVDWGRLYNLYGEEKFDSEDLEKQVQELMRDDEVKRKAGIYTYVLDGDRKHLNLRTFTQSQKRGMYERQGGKCANGEHCKTVGNEDGEKIFTLREMEADHITPWSKGGKTVPENGQMLCRPCNRQKAAN